MSSQPQAERASPGEVGGQPIAGGPREVLQRMKVEGGSTGAGCRGHMPDGRSGTCGGAGRTLPRAVASQSHTTHTSWCDTISVPVMMRPHVWWNDAALANHTTAAKTAIAMGRRNISGARQAYLPREGVCAADAYLYGDNRTDRLKTWNAPDPLITYPGPAERSRPIAARYRPERCAARCGGPRSLQPWTAKARFQPQDAPQFPQL